MFDKYFAKEDRVNQALNAGPRGDGCWPGFSVVYITISDACTAMGATPGFRLNKNHIQSIADLGSGHEQRMKSRLRWLQEYGWGA